MADIQLTLTIPDAYTTRILAAFNAISGGDIRTRIIKNNNVSRLSYTIAPKEVAENNKEFAIRFIEELIRSNIKIYEYALDKIRYESELDDITPISTDVPNDIIVGE